MARNFMPAWRVRVLSALHWTVCNISSQWHVTTHKAFSLNDSVSLCQFPLSLALFSLSSHICLISLISHLHGSSVSLVLQHSAGPRPTMWNSKSLCGEWCTSTLSCWCPARGHSDLILTSCCAMCVELLRGRRRSGTIPAKSCPLQFRGSRRGSGLSAHIQRRIQHPLAQSAHLPWLWELLPGVCLHDLSRGDPLSQRRPWGSLACERGFRTGLVQLHVPKIALVLRCHPRRGHSWGSSACVWLQSGGLIQANDGTHSNRPPTHVFHDLPIAWHPTMFSQFAMEYLPLVVVFHERFEFARWEMWSLN